MKAKQVALIVVLVALVVAVHLTGVLASGSRPDKASPRDDRNWPETVSGLLHRVPGLARDLAPDDVAGRPCVRPEGDAVALIGCDALAVPDGVDRVVLRLTEPACIVTAVTPGQLSQSFDTGDAEGDGLLRIPVAGEGTILRLSTVAGTAPCRARVAG